MARKAKPKKVVKTAKPKKTQQKSIWRHTTLEVELTAIGLRIEQVGLPRAAVWPLSKRFCHQGAQAELTAVRREQLWHDNVLGSRGKARLDCDWPDPDSTQPTATLQSSQSRAGPGLHMQMSPDGNCFFRAVADQLHGDASQHVDIRRQVVQHMRDNEASYAPFVEFDEAFGKYADRMARVHSPYHCMLRAWSCCSTLFGRRL